MNRQSLVLASISALFLFASVAPAPIIIGNGSDPRTLVWTNAKVGAVNRIHKVQNFERFLRNDGETPQLIREFLVGPGVLESLKMDVFNAKHLYDTDPHPVVAELCALTNVPDDLNDVRIFLPACEAPLSQFGAPFAIRTLIHESVHHMLRDEALREQYGIVFSGTDVQRYNQEEEFANGVAAALERAFDRVADIGEHYWRDMSVDHDGMPERGFHSAVWTGATANPAIADKMIVWGGCKENLSAIYGCGEYLKSGGIYDPSPDADEWTRIDEATAPEERAYHSSVWTGASEHLPDHLIVFGGCSRGDYCDRYLNDGAIFDPAANLWEKLPTLPWAQLPPRAFHSLAWSGRHAIVWGGETAAPQQAPRPLADGAVYDATTKEWRVLPATPAEILAPRSHHTAIWTGDTGNAATANKMLVWGGCDVEVFNGACSHYFNDGALFDPMVTDPTQSWTKLAASGVAATPRRLHTATYVNTPDLDGTPRNLLIVWGGERNGQFLGDGAILDLRTNRWRQLSNLGPGPRARHTAVWTGEGLLVFGGVQPQGVYATELSFYTLPSPGQPAGRWRAITSDYYPMRAQNHAAVWTGKDMIVWGGQTDRLVFQNVGAIFRFGAIF